MMSSRESVEPGWPLESVVWVRVKSTICGVALTSPNSWERPDETSLAGEIGENIGAIGFPPCLHSTLITC